MNKREKENYERLAKKYIELNHRYNTVSRKFEKIVNSYRLLPTRAFMDILETELQL